MKSVVPGRYSAEMEGSFVVFLIGMRINRPLAVHKWLPTLTAMGPMLRELYQHPELGFLRAETFWNWRGPIVIQYWRSFEDLERYARHGIHLTAWKHFNRTVGTDGSVGIFHETYLVKAGQYEALYVNMPVFGLAKAGQHVPATGKRETARRRLGDTNEPIVATPPNPI